jgi:hypothetical protein
MTRLLRALVLSLTAIAMMLPAVSHVAAADVVFGTPSATAKYLESITFTVPFDTSVPLKRIELRLRFPGSIGPHVIDVPVPPAGERTLSYTLDTTGDGHIVPNTAIEATWAAVPQAGVEPVLSSPQTVLYEDTRQEWRTVKGDVVVVHWYEGDEGFGRKALQIGEDAVKKTADLLGVTVTEPIDFFIYGDEAAFMDAMGPGTREWVAGRSISNIRTLFGLITPDQIDSSEVDRVVSHEMVHLVFHSAVDGPYGYPPAWFDEGLATYLSEGYNPSYRRPVEAAASSEELIPLTALAGSFPTDADRGWLAYAESTSAIDYIMRTYGQEALLSIVAGYKDGLTDDEALTKATGKDMAAFQDGWLADLGAGAPRQYGPVPNPPGPVPPGWDAPIPGASPGASPGTASPPPGASVGPSSPGEPGDPTGSSDAPLILLALGGVALVVVVGMVVARRRSAVP